MHQHRAVGEGRPHNLEHSSRHPGRRRDRVSLELGVALARHVHLWRVVSHHRPGSGHGNGPAGLDQCLGLHRPRRRPDQRTRAFVVRSQQQHLPCMRVGGARLGVQVVAVVPDRDQTKVVHRRERRRPAADDDADNAARDGQEAPVTSGRPEVGRQDHVVALPQEGGQRGVDPADVTGVRQAEHAAAPGLRGRCRSLRETIGPRLTRQGGPDGARGAAIGESIEQAAAAVVRRPSRACTLERQRRRHGPSRDRLCLDTAMAGRHGQPEYVGHRAGIAIGDELHEVMDGRREHRLGRHDLAEWCQPTGVVGLVEALDEEPANVTPGEPDLDPAAGLGLLVERRGHGVVEGSVEVRQRQVNQHPRDRELRRRTCHRTRPSAADLALEQGQLLVVRLLRHDPPCLPAEADCAGALRSDLWAQE